MHYIKMKGNRCSERRAHHGISDKDALEKSGVRSRGRPFSSHQANLRIIKATAKRLGEQDKIFVNVHKY
jgi:3-oxoacyl-[acyl-carrier-protein] synthase III